MEGIGGITAVSAGIGKQRDQLFHLDERPGPA
jgi:hypothetical protein